MSARVLPEKILGRSGDVGKLTESLGVDLPLIRRRIGKLTGAVRKKVEKTLERVVSMAETHLGYAHERWLSGQLSKPEFEHEVNDPDKLPIVDLEKFISSGDGFVKLDKFDPLTGNQLARMFKATPLSASRETRLALAGVGGLLLALSLSGCNMQDYDFDGFIFENPDAQPDGAPDVDVSSDATGGDAKIEVKPVDAGDVEDVKDAVDVNDTGDVQDAKDAKDVGDTADVQDIKDTQDTEIDAEIPPPCAGVDCDDKDPCTDDKCEEATGQCASTPKPLTDDGDECTTESCGADGETVHTPVDPNDDDPCTDDLCDPATGKKTNTPKNVDDKNPCTDDLCDPVTGEPINTDKDCSDGNPFTTDACNPATGECTHVPPVCDDGNPCTKDGYDPVKGCSNEPVDCEDGDACTEGDACNPENGKCESTPKDCSDGDGCTKDVCLPPEGDCVNPLKPIESDGNPCTKDGCDPATGLPIHDEIPCSDGSACTVWDECDPADGKCKGEAVDCDDKDGCTKDTCDPATGCKNTPVNTDDKNACTKDACDKTTGAVTHTPVNVSDGKTCTTDGCNPQTGEIVHALNDTVCAALNDQCAKGVCSPGESTADPITGCAKSFLAFNGAPCDDGDECSFDDLCDMGICTSVDWMDCDDGVACTKDSCDKGTGACVNVGDDGKCGDGNLCTNDECLPSVPGSDPISGCQNEVKSCNLAFGEGCWDKTGGCIPEKQAPLSFKAQADPGNIFWEVRYVNGKLAQVKHNTDATTACPVGTNSCVVSFAQLNNLSSIEITADGENDYFALYKGACLLGLPEGSLDPGEIVTILQDFEPETVTEAVVENTVPGNCITVQVNQF